MKIGLILECGPGGPDEQVFRHLAMRFHPKIELECETMSQKPKLIEGCGKAASLLLESGCDKVGIIWDLYPPWRDKGDQHCRGRDRKLILESLAADRVHVSKVHLVCIQEELEAWLLADKRALTKFLSTASHKAKKVPEYKDPESISNPKGVLRDLLRQFGKGRYNEFVHPHAIIQHVADWAKIKRCPSFVRFAERIFGVRV